MRARNYMRLFACLLCVLTHPVLADTPARVQASYDVLKAGIRVATITETFTRTPTEYRIESVSKASGLLAAFKPEIITVTSLGSVTAQGLRPHTFNQLRKLDPERNTRADLDWDSNSITLTDYGGVRKLPLPVGVQDRLSAMYQFMFLDLQHADVLDFYMTNGNKLDTYTYRITPGQSVTVPFGTFKALYVASPQKAGENRTEIWLATELDNFPCKMVITDSDGGKLTQVLTQFNSTP